nr:M3-type thioredoxin family protein [Passiflora tenuiloba]QKY65127.1 M3-type thioredoxin family protein [Passiflora tenuiloba]
MAASSAPASLCAAPSSSPCAFYRRGHLNPNLFSFPVNSPGKIATNVTVKKLTPPPLTIVCSRGSSAAAVSLDTWEEFIVKSDIPVLVEFYASWCGPCRMVHRVIDEIAGEYDGRLKCFVLNTDTDMTIAEKYEIKAVPVVFLFKNGEKQESVVGTMPKEFYVAAIERVLQS